MTMAADLGEGAIMLDENVSLTAIGNPLPSPWWLRASIGEQIVPVVALILAERCEIRDAGKYRLGVCLTAWVVWEGNLVLAHEVEDFKGFGYARGADTGVPDADL